MKQKLIIDCIPLLKPLTGIGRYTYEITQSVLKSKYYNMTFFYGYASKHFVDLQKNSSMFLMRKILTRNDGLKKLARKFLNRFGAMLDSSHDLYWQPNFIPLKTIRAKKVIATVHDFSWEYYPEFHPKERVAYFKDNFYQAIMRCDHIITGSYFTKNEIMERAGFKAEAISVIYHGINHGLFYPRVTSSTIQQNFILAVGSIEPRKNLKNLLFAYAMLPLPMKETYHLLLAGAGGWQNQEIMALITQQHPFVRYSGFVDDETLAQLYNDATLFVYPSFYEGFGIPPLEAMACGTPVLCSNASTLPEVCQDAAYYIEPTDINAIKEAIITLLNDSDLRHDLIEKGLQRASFFSWEKSAKEHQKIFEALLSN